MKYLLVLLVCLAVASPRRAEAEDGVNALIGPVLGLRLGGPAGGRGIVGVEGGFGIGPERLNLGFTRRLDKTFAYVEVDPWYVLGFSFGAGVDSDGEMHPVLGIWEGWPLDYPGCSDDGWQRVVTIAGGYRYTGVHELYLTAKAGATYEGGLCFD